MLTRKHYVSGRCTHQEYYIQFSNASQFRSVLDVIGLDAIVKSAGDRFAAIPIKLWDSIPLHLECYVDLISAGDTLSLASAVCINKAIALEIKQEIIYNRRSKEITA